MRNTNKKYAIISLSLMMTMAVSTALAKNSGDPFMPTFAEIAPGVWSGIRDDNPRFPVMGTVTFVISDVGVVVYDGGGAPKMAEHIIDKIKSLTDKPVTHVVVSHWHGDHNFGIYRYLEEFKNVQVIGHSFTKMVMESPRIRYIDDYPTFMESYRKTIAERMATGKMSDGRDVTPVMRAYYARVLEDGEMVDESYKRAKVTVPTVTFDDKYTIQSGDRTIELLFLGHGNTAGDISLWLPKEKIVATGDTVVHPMPYAFNVPPRKWSATLRNIKALDYKIMVPGHGDIQRDTKYIDLIIETSDSVADQRDKLLADGVPEEEAKKQIDFSAFEKRFTGGDEYQTIFYKAWFEGPLRAAAFKALKGGPMVDLSGNN